MNLDPDPLQRGLARAVAAIGADCAWADLARLGAFALALPVEAGGLDLGLSAQVVVSAELGAMLRALPGYHDTLLAADLLTGACVPEAHVLRADIAAGSARVATGGVHHGPVGTLDDGGALHGLCDLLPAVDWTAAVVRTRLPVHATAPGAGAATGKDVWVIVDPRGAACTREPVETLAGPAQRLRFTGAACVAILPGSPALDLAIRAARIRQAAFLTGIARATLLAARRYVTRREQFGRKLIEFQTIGHRLATLVAEGDGLEMLVHEAAWRFDTGRPLRAHAPQALAAAAEFALQASRLAVQLHGARGILADGLPAIAYRLAAVEAVRLGPLQALWQEAGLHRLTEDDRWDDGDARADLVAPADDVHGPSHEKAPV